MEYSNKTPINSLLIIIVNQFDYSRLENCVWFIGSKQGWTGYNEGVQNYVKQFGNRSQRGQSWGTDTIC